MQQPSSNRRFRACTDEGHSAGQVSSLVKEFSEPVGESRMGNEGGDDEYQLQPWDQQQQALIHLI